jgi:tape measure domain-containing protein
MASVDDRVVRMEFDNAAFERKVDSTIKSLADLDKAMKFDGAKEGLSGVSDAIGKFHLGAIGDAVTGIASKFEALGIIGITVLTNITNKAINSGIQIAKSLSLDQIISGFKEYELNMQSIQTILSNTKADGTNLQQVNAALDQLNTYADKTIYNFGQMTKNIGTFTAAGVDLDTSVQSIKGISNLAAISGSSAEQASTAMYQLSQAVSTGTLKLMDWNSVVNAGMGGEVFQKALFETGKAMHTIKDAKLDTTFEEWTKKSGSFRDSLQDGWVTSEVLTNTLKGFTGELTDDQLAAIGYTKEQIAQIQELGKTGVEAATKVRTLTQLIDTTKEAIGSGWSESFRIVFGNFEEATTLFTGISDAVGTMVKKSSDARNELLQGWKDLGGRTLLIESLQTTISNLGKILQPIKDAFHDIFPPLTADRLMAITTAFSNFAKALEPSGATVEHLKSIFEGLFSVLKIGWTVIKETASFIADLFRSLTGAGSGGFLTLAAGVGDFLTNAKNLLVDGGGIHAFFDTLRDKIKPVIDYIQQVKDKVVDFVKGIDPANLDAVSGAFGRLGDRWESLKELFHKAEDIWANVKPALMKIVGVLEEVWGAIKRWFEGLWDRVAGVMKEGDFSKVTDALNVGLLATIAGVLAKFFKDGLKIDLGGGFFEKISGAFDQLTGILKSMQTEIKAEALLKIAEAIGILSASVLVLSLIDSDALTRSLVAMSVGFGQLMGAFAILNKMDVDLKGAATFTALATGMIILSGAILILSAAVKVLASMSWEELAKGLVGVTVLLGVLTGAAVILSANSSGLIRAGLGLLAIAVSLNILAGAVKIFAMMSWSEMGQGFAAVAGGLLIIAGALQLMPNGASMALQGVGLLAVATSMVILAAAMKSFAGLSWGDMAKGFVGVGGGLLIIAGAMQLMPLTMPIIGADLLLVSISLIAIAKAMQMMGGLSWGEIGKGLATMAASLLILAVATTAMTGSIAGAIAIGIVSASLLLLAKVLEAFAGISWGDLIHGMAAIAIALGVLAVSALLIEPAIPAMLALGAALLLIGAGFALFGVGAQLVAKAFEMMAKAGEAGAKGLTASLEAIGAALPALVKGFAQGILDLIDILVKAAPVIVKGLVEVLSYLLEGLGKLIPQVVDLIGELITQLLDLIKEKYPEFIEAGISLIISLLTGIRNHIGEVVTLVGDIITEFIDALAVEIPRIIDSVANFIIEVFQGAAEAAGRVAATMMFGVALSFIQGFMDGLADAMPGPMQWFLDLASKVLGWIGNVVTTLKDKGIDFITGLLDGITDKAKSVISFFNSLANNVLGWIGSTIGTLWNKGFEFITGLLNGINDKIGSVTSIFTSLVGNVKSWIGEVGSALWDKGFGLIQGLYDGVKDKWNDLKNWVGDIGSRIAGAIGDLGRVLYDAGKAVINGLWNGMKDVWSNVTGWLGNLNPANLFNDINYIKGHAGQNLVPTGKAVMQGLHTAMEDEWDNVAKWLSTLDPSSEMDKNMSDNVASVINGAISQIVDQLNTSLDFNPTITPVLDLTRIAEDAKQIGNYIQTSEKLSPTYSTAQARTIASSTNAQQEDTIKAPAGSGEVHFEQNIYSPTQLSTSDIYKQTRNQITMAKEELSIP